MATSHIFRIMFVNQGKVYEVYARKVSHGELFGFIEVEELLFQKAQPKPQLSLVPDSRTA